MSIPEPTPTLDPANVDMAAVQAFVDKWALNDSCLDRIATLCPESLEVVMRDFKPGVAPPFNREFISFATAVHNRPAGQKHRPEAKPHPLSSLARHAGQPWQTPSPVFAGKGGKGGKGGRGSEGDKGDRRGPHTAQKQDGSWDESVDLTALQAFVTKWELNEDALRRIASLSPVSLQVVLREFDPPGVEPGTNVNGKFIAFATSVDTKQRSQSGGGSRPHPLAVLALAKGGLNVPQQPVADMNTVPDLAELQLFVNKWGLNDVSIAAMGQLSPAALRMLLQEFVPEGESEDWNGMFQLFVAQVQSRLGL